MPDTAIPVRSREVSWLTLVLRADPDYYREKRNEIEYEFPNGKTFYGDSNTRGAYSD